MFGYFSPMRSVSVPMKKTFLTSNYFSKQNQPKRFQFFSDVMFEQNFWMKCQIRSGECLWHKNLKSYLRWVLWSSKVNQYKETMTNDQSKNGGLSSWWNHLCKGWGGELGLLQMRTCVNKGERERRWGRKIDHKMCMY